MVELMIVGVVVLIILSIFFFLIKRLFLVGVVLAIVYVIFHIGYIWEAEDLKENLRIDSWASEKTSSAIENTYNNFSKNRKEFSVLDLPKLKDTIMDDVSEYAQNIKNADREELFEKINEQFKGLSTEEFERALKETKEIWGSVFTESEFREVKGGE